jgi:hypothetical protein
MAMEIPSFLLGLQCTAGKGLVSMPKKSLKKKGQTN